MLDALAREGARQMLAAALQVEVAAYIELNRTGFSGRLGVMSRDVWSLTRLIVEDGWKVAVAARMFMVSPVTARKGSVRFSV